MNHETNRRSLAFRALALSAALTWIAADVAVAGQSSASSSRSSNRSSASSSSGSKASAPSRGSSGSQASSGRRAVSRSASGSRSSSSRDSARSGSRARSGDGAARTRTGQRPPNRRGGGGRYYGGRYGGYYGAPYYWSPWGYWGWGLSFGNVYGGYGYGHAYPPVVYSSRPGYRMGALDLNVRPKNTEIYVDGQYVGLAKQYDGFPGHLWLEKGVYEIAFYKPGFETQTRTVKVMTDLILDLEIAMRAGVAVEPEMRFLPGENRERVEGASDEVADRRTRPERGDYQARLHLNVEPRQALIYLDGNILGTADELAGLHAGLILSSGAHSIEVVHRGYVTVERAIDVAPGEEVDFQLTLVPAADNASP